MTNKTNYFLIIFLFIINTFSADIVYDGGPLTVNIYRKTINHIFNHYPYYIYIPDNYNGQKRFSVIFLISGKDIPPIQLMQESSIHHYAEEKEFIIVMPDFRNTDITEKRKLLTEIMKDILENYIIDEKNISCISMFENSDIFVEEKYAKPFTKFIFVEPSQDKLSFFSEKPTTIITTAENNGLIDGAVRIILSGKLYSWPGGKKALPFFQRPDENSNFNLTEFLFKNL